MGYSNDNFWKFDKWDKIGIASLFIFFTIFAVFNTFSFGASSVDLVEKNGLGTNQDTGFLVPASNNNGFYFRAYKGVSYNLVNNSSTISFVVCRLSDIPDVGVSFSDRVVLPPSQSLELELSNDTNMYIYCLQANYVPDITVTSDIDNYMLFSMDRLGDITFSGLWDTFNKSIPFILFVVLVSFGFYLISHAIKEISKGRDI